MIQKKWRKWTAAVAAGLMMTAVIPFQAFAVTREQAMDWVQAREGTFVGRDEECVSFLEEYYEELFGLVVWGDAKDYKDNIGDGWTQIAYVEGEPFEVKTGDVAVWTVSSFDKIDPETGRTWGELYGHVAVVCESLEDGFTYYGQNPDPLHLETCHYEKFKEEGWVFWGVVRPPFEEDAVSLQ
ncbi:MAG: hypothetical protein LUE86_09585 [Clostridiales bacterium]|nr:hypothetical protein [Clostridiales bacterium]